jgi:CubicO group peptidase (beta-lactamase class C family)
VTPTAVPIDGRCDPAFSAVRDAFVRNFHDHGEHGASVTVTVAGRVVADLWGGHRDAARTRAFEPDTLVNVFSVGKGLVALLAARLVGTGVLDVDRPVARHWPEFAARGKESITVRDLLSHRAGLPAVRRRLPPGAMLDWAAMTAALADEEPWWEPGTAHGYHVNSFGFLVGEVLRRVTGRSVGTLLRDEVARPLEADVHLGLPTAEHGRVAEFLWPGDPPPEREPAGLTDDELMRHNAYFNPAGGSGAGVVNTPRWRCAEIPSTNTHASARGIARVYTALAADGTHDGVRLADPSALAAATTEQAAGHDRVLERPTRFGLGFQLTQPERPLGPSPTAFGHFGAGGSLGFCDPESGVAFGYAMNQIGARWRNPRNRALIDAVYESLGS